MERSEGDKNNLTYSITIAKHAQGKVWHFFLFFFNYFLNSREKFIFIMFVNFFKVPSPSIEGILISTLLHIFL